MNLDDVITTARKLMTELMVDIPNDHGSLHADAVHAHAISALVEEHNVTKLQKLCVELAALLHDTDDHKLKFKTENNAKRILNESFKVLKGVDRLQIIGYIVLVLRMIDLVSASKNKETFEGPSWMLIPRHSDRLEAIGYIGIVRCLEYAKRKNEPYYLPDTPRVTTEEELMKIATKERFDAYKGESRSVIDHCYDKLVHICNLDTTNTYLQIQANVRKQSIVSFVLHFGVEGNINRYIRSIDPCPAA
jgi:uncharacterized protein